MRGAWNVVEPGQELVWGWHIDAIIEHLEAVAYGWITKLIINIPPRCMKSLLVSVFFPAWVWTWWPQCRFLSASYVLSLAGRDSRKTKLVIESPWYQERWGKKFHITKDQRAIMRYENNHRGARVALNVGAGTGEGGDIRIIDDPHNAEKVHSDQVREGDLTWFRETWSTRANDPLIARDVLIMQRLHERDMTGFILEEIGGYEHLCLPMEFEKSRACVTAVWKDKREADGDLMWPQRFGSEQVRVGKKTLGSYGAAGQFQQRPAPAEGNIIKAQWLRYWYPPDQRPPPPVRIQTSDGWFTCPQIALPLRFDDRHQSWDMSFRTLPIAQRRRKSEGDSASYVVGQVWYSRFADAFLIHQVRDRFGFTETCEAVKALSRDYPTARRKWVEAKANGPEVIASLKQQLPGLIPISVEGDKEARAHAASPHFEGGNVYLPHPNFCPWVDAYVSEITQFPGAAHDDQVDATTQYIIKKFMKGTRGKQLAVVMG